MHFLNTSKKRSGQWHYDWNLKLSVVHLRLYILTIYELLVCLSVRTKHNSKQLKKVMPTPSFPKCPQAISSAGKVLVLVFCLFTTGFMRRHILGDDGSIYRRNWTEKGQGPSPRKACLFGVATPNSTAAHISAIAMAALYDYWHWYDETIGREAVYQKLLYMYHLSCTCKRNLCMQLGSSQCSALI